MKTSLLQSFFKEQNTVSGFAIRRFARKFKSGSTVNANEISEAKTQLQNLKHSHANFSCEIKKIDSEISNKLKALQSAHANSTMVHIELKNLQLNKANLELKHAADIGSANNDVQDKKAKMAVAENLAQQVLTDRTKILALFEENQKEEQDLTIIKQNRETDLSQANKKIKDAKDALEKATIQVNEKYKKELSIKNDNVARKYNAIIVIGDPKHNKFIYINADTPYHEVLDALKMYNCDIKDNITINYLKKSDTGFGNATAPFNCGGYYEPSKKKFCIPSTGGIIANAKSYKLSYNGRNLIIPTDGHAELKEGSNVIQKFDFKHGFEFQNLVQMDFFNGELKLEHGYIKVTTKDGKLTDNLQVEEIENEKLKRTSSMNFSSDAKNPNSINNYFKFGAPDKSLMDGWWNKFLNIYDTKYGVASSVLVEIYPKFEQNSLAMLNQWKFKTELAIAQTLEKDLKNSEKAQQKAQKELDEATVNLSNKKLELANTEKALQQLTNDFSSAHKDQIDSTIQLSQAQDTSKKIEQNNLSQKFVILKKTQKQAALVHFAQKLLLNIDENITGLQNAKHDIETKVDQSNTLIKSLDQEFKDMKNKHVGKRALLRHFRNFYNTLGLGRMPDFGIKNQVGLQKVGITLNKSGFGLDMKKLEQVLSTNPKELKRSLTLFGRRLHQAVIKHNAMLVRFSKINTGSFEKYMQVARYTIKV